MKPKHGGSRSGTMDSISSSVVLTEAMSPSSALRRRPNFISARRELMGHYGKVCVYFVSYSTSKVTEVTLRSVSLLMSPGQVYEGSWAGDSLHLSTVSQDGKLLVWNTMLGNKTHLVKLRSSWIMSASLNDLASGPPRFAAAGISISCRCTTALIFSSLLPSLLFALKAHEISVLR